MFDFLPPLEPVKQEKPPVEPMASHETTERSPLLSVAGGSAVAGAMRSGPLMTRILHEGARAAMKAKTGIGSLSAGPKAGGALAVAGYVADPLVSRGDLETTGKRAGVVGGAYAAGKVAKKAAEITTRTTANPMLAEMIKRNTGNARFGAVARGAEQVAKGAGPVGLAVTTATLPAHGPTADTPDGARIQERVYREYAAKVNAKRGQQVFPPDLPLADLIRAVKAYRDMTESKTSAPEGFLREMMERRRGRVRG